MNFLYQGFAEKCAEYNVDPEALVSYISKQSEEDTKDVGGNSRSYYDYKRRRAALYLLGKALKGAGIGAVGGGLVGLLNNPSNMLRDIGIGAGVGTAGGLGVGLAGRALNDFVGVDPYARSVTQVRSKI